MSESKDIGRRRLDRRNAERVAVALPLVLKPLDEGQHAVIPGESIEISAGGLKFHSNYFFERGAKLSIVIQVPKAVESVKVVSKIIESNRETGVHRAEFIQVKNHIGSILAEYISAYALKNAAPERRQDERRKDVLEKERQLKSAEILIQTITKTLKRRVVVTGMGVVSPVGIGHQEFWNAILEGKSGVRQISLFDTGDYPVHIAAEVKNFDPSQYMSPQLANQIDRFAQFGIAASRLAVEDASLKINRQRSNRIGVLIGTSAAGMTIVEEQLETFRKFGHKKLSPFAVASIITSNCPSQIAIALGITGPSFSLSTACASGTDAIGTAFQMIRNGDLDVAVAGSAEALITPFVVNLFYSAGVLSNRNDDPESASRPFDKDRDGSVIGEGAGVLVLEELEHARNRGAKIYAEVIGYGRTTDAFHAIRQLHSGAQAVRAIEECIKDAGISPSMIDHVNAHGSSTVFSDRIENRVLREVLGKHAERVTISATKSMIGHLQGGCGGPEIIACILGMNDNLAHHIRNYSAPDPECDLDYVSNKPRKQEINIALKNSFGFGGKNAALLVQKFSPT